MNFLVFGTCWIASATVFGILFSYSPWELTPTTSALALSAGVIVSAAFLWGRRAQKPLKVANSASIISVLMSVLFLTFTVRQFSQVIFVVNDSIRVLSFTTKITWLNCLTVKVRKSTDIKTEMIDAELATLRGF